MIRTGYHYSNAVYAVGQTVARTQPKLNLTAKEQRAEAFIRSNHPDGLETGEKIRTTALYLWRDKAKAEALWLQKRSSPFPESFLYVMEFDTDDVMHESDLDIYSEVKDAITDEKATSSATRYWSSDLSSAGPRVEILVLKAVVVSVEDIVNRPLSSNSTYPSTTDPLNDLDGLFNG